MQTSRISSVRLFFSLLTGVAALSCAAVFVRFAHAEGMPALSIAAWRMIVACAALLPYAVFTRRTGVYAGQPRELLFMVIAGVSLGLHFAAWIASLSFTTVAHSVVLVSMGPLFVTSGSRVFLRERTGRATMTGVVLAVAGSVIIGSGDLGSGGQRLFGDLLALAGALFVAVYLLAGRRVRPGRPLIAYIAPVYCTAMLTLLSVVILSGRPMSGFSAGAYLWVLCLGLVPQLLGHSTLNWALARLSTAFVAILTLAEPVGASVLAWLVLDEAITLRTALGALPILAGVYVASREEAKRR